MVVVLKKPKLIYIEEPRTASRSTHVWLTKTMGGVSPWLAKKNGLPAHNQRHMGPMILVDRVRNRQLPLVQFLQDDFVNYRCFAFTRNPFNTLVTYYVKARNGQLAPAGRGKEHILAAKAKTFKEFITQILEKYPGVVSEEPHIVRLGACQHILRFEDGYPNVLFDFLDSHGVPVSAGQKKAFPHEGKTQHKKKNWRSYYEDAEIIEVVANIYETYLARYGYDFDCN